MNLILVDKCTNYCAYCFASTVMAEQSKRASLSRDSIELLCEFVAKCGPDFTINLIGGEPFLYQDLDYLLARLFSISNVSRATIFTGAIFKQRALDVLAPFRDKVSILVNLNERRDYKRESDYAAVRRNMARSLELGFHTGIGFNIWREDFDYEEILTVCHEYGVEHLRWTIAYPEAKPMPGVTVLSPERYAATARRCFRFLEHAFQQNVEAYLDCPLPKCFFSHEELGRIAVTHPRTVSQIKACGPVIDVSPDLSVFRCYALSQEQRRHLTEFQNLSALTSWYEQAIDETYAQPSVFEKCASCEFAENRTCYGGCMAHSASSLQARPRADQMVGQIYGALESGDFGQALRLLGDFPRKDATAAIMHAYAHVGLQDLKAALIWARIASNRSRSNEVKAVAISLMREILNAPITS